MSLARGPIAGHEELWWYAWPSAFSDLVDEATNVPESVDPELVYSIMREESGYRPKVVSPVGARGLLVLTGKGADTAMLAPIGTEIYADLAAAVDDLLREHAR